MTVKLVAQIICGFTPCDIHGEHRPVIYVEATGLDRGRVRLSRNTPDRDYRYNVVIESACFGDASYTRLTSDTAADALAEWAFLPHTKQGIRSLRFTEKLLRDRGLDIAREYDRLPGCRSQVPQPVEAAATADLIVTVPTVSPEILQSFIEMSQAAENAGTTINDMGRSYAQQAAQYATWSYANPNPYVVSAHTQPAAMMAAPEVEGWNRTTAIPARPLLEWHESMLNEDPEPNYQEYDPFDDLF